MRGNEYLSLRSLRTLLSLEVERVHKLPDLIVKFGCVLGGDFGLDLTHGQLSIRSEHDGIVLKYLSGLPLWKDNGLAIRWLNDSPRRDGFIQFLKALVYSIGVAIDCGL